MMRAQIKRRGNGASLRITAKVVAAAGIRIGQTVQVTAHNGRIIIQPIYSSSGELDRMIDAIPTAFPKTPISVLRKG